MSEDLGKGEQLLMWALFAAGGEKLLKDIEPKPRGTPHHLLARKGYLATSHRNRSILLVLQDKGWRWIADAEPFPIAPDEKRITAERRLLQSLMRSIKRYADESGKPIQDLFRPEPKKRASESSVAGRHAKSADRSSRIADTEIEAEIAAAFFDVAGRPARGNIRLSELRKKLAHLPRDQVDSTLVAMWRASKANLMNLDNPRDIEAEESAALKTGVHTFHVVRVLE